MNNFYFNISELSRKRHQIDRYITFCDREITMYPDKMDVEEYLARVRADRLRKPNALLENVEPTLREKVRVEVGEGVPFEEILKRVSLERADLVIMGNKGRSNLASTLFGSTAEKVFKYAEVPVVSVRSRV